VPAPVKVTIDEWTVPWEQSRPGDPFVDGSGQVWFAGQAGNYVARLDPLSGKFTRFEIDSGTSPSGLVVTPDGTVWFAGSGKGIIGQLDPATGRLKRHRVGQVGATDPHGLVLDRRGQLWFTAQESNRVGRLDTKTGEFRIVRIGRDSARPDGIVVDGKQLPWVALSGMSYLLQYNPATLGGYPYQLPNRASRVRRLAATSDGKIWYGDYARGMVGRLDPATRETREWPLPSGAKSAPYAMAVDDRDRVWVVETGVRPNRLVAFDTRTLAIVANEPIAKSGGGSVRHMTWDAVSRTLWFGTDENTIGRAIIVD
jgi:virginiamycin B lyase